MDPYVLALQLYLFNKACGGIPLRIAEQVVVSGVLNATYWTAKQIGSGVLWLVWPSGKSRVLSESNGDNNNLESEFEIINSDDIPEMTKLKTINDEIKNESING